MLRESQRDDKQAQGGVEGYQRRMQEQTRVGRLDLEKRFEGFSIKSKDAVLKWLIRHSSWLLSKYVVKGSTGKTSHEHTRGKPYTSEVYSFGMTMLGLPAKDDRNAKLSSNCVKGAWLGRSHTSNSHIIGNSDGIYLCRSVRSLPPEEDHDPQHDQLEGHSN
jgi:hypothetical protein